MERLKKEVAWLLSEKYGSETHSLSAEQADVFSTDLKRLEDGEPLAYIIGQVPFLNTIIYLDSHPLIPRPETEYWTSKAIKEMGGLKNSLSVLDLCAGSGCIGIAILKAFPIARVDLAEIDARHHATMAKNLRENGIDSSRTRIYGGDLFMRIHKKYDVILSNPPYIDPLRNRTEESVRGFEPHEALYGGKRGFEIIERILRESPNHLKRNGVLYIEHEPEHVHMIKRTGELAGFSVEIFPDQYGTQRCTRLTRI